MPKIRFAKSKCMGWATGGMPNLSRVIPAIIAAPIRLISKYEQRSIRLLFSTEQYIFQTIQQLVNKIMAEKERCT